ncbi:MAG: transposase, partial [Firmicutes bacterium]|nr:transposase [Bacillota bacterium]
MGAYKLNFRSCKSSAKRRWLALLSTDTELSDEEIVRIYGQRGVIEVFFKATKSFLGLGKEYQSRCYDALVAHTTIVFMRYTMLEIESRDEEDPR